MIKTTQTRASLKKPMRRANRRLKLMGLDPTIRIEQKEAWMIIPISQLIKLINSKIAHQNKEVMLEGDKIVIHIWKGEVLEANT